MHYGRNEAVSTVDFRQEIVILCERLIPAVIDIRIIRMKDLPDLGNLFPEGLVKVRDAAAYGHGYGLRLV